MRSNTRILTYVIVGLIVIGILYRLNQFIIPIIVLGIIFLLYKFPPNRWFQANGAHRSGYSDRNQKTRTSKKAKFRVIRGNKQSDDDPPKYH